MEGNEGEVNEWEGCLLDKGEKETKSFYGERDWMDIWKHSEDNNLYIFSTWLCKLLTF